MKNIKRISILFACFTLISCNQAPDKKIENLKIIEQVKSETDIVLPECISIEEEMNEVMGDYTKFIIVKFDSINFNILKERINSKIRNNTQSGNTLNIDKEFQSKKWGTYESGYKFETSFPNKNAKSTYYANFSNQTLFYLYVEE